MDTRKSFARTKSDKHYDKKYEDMQARLDKLYDEIEEIETLIEEVETGLYNIRQEKTFMKNFLADMNIYEEDEIGKNK
ncbi:MAG: hypothetical protein IJ029_10650 [Lachnospiraceae bacterium]|nr:hypothetical protein [Lachnospiraceae bacterium]